MTKQLKHEVRLIEFRNDMRFFNRVREGLISITVSFAFTQIWSPHAIIQFTDSYAEVIGRSGRLAESMQCYTTWFIGAN